MQNLFQVTFPALRASAPKLVVLVTCVGLLGAALGTAHAASPSDTGTFSKPFSEPTIKGKETNKKCIEYKDDHGDGEETHLECKPAAGSVSVLSNGKVLYWNALEGTENIKNGIGAEFGSVSINDQSRVLDIQNRTWSQPTPNDGGAASKGYETEPLVPGGNSEKRNDGALFCADLSQLPDGRIFAVGGTAYYNDPGVDGGPSMVELEGLRSSRIFDPRTERWTQADDMKFGRWYPTLVTLADGDVFVASGVQKLLKPLYPNHPQDSGTNIKQTETYDVRADKWRYNGTAADRSLPLYPRLHLLPNGHVFYNAAGQAYNPSGQSYDEALWNMAASYDPKRKRWSDLGIAGLGTATPGFRGSTFSIMLPLQANRSGRYTSAEFLTAGGVLGTTPGSYIPVPFSSITSVDTSDDNTLASRSTGSLNHSRWYSTGILLPSGEVVAFSGADRDEVIGPGSGFPVTQAELFDPKSETWRPIASARQARTYHNSATLLPDGRVLVGGHAPIPTLYGAHSTMPGGFSPNEGRDPTFEIFSPPYLFRGDRPEIRKAPKSISYGDKMNIVVDGDAGAIKSVVLVRNPSLTHLVDGDQRNVELEILARNGRSLTVAAPPDGNVAPPGPYMLFVNRSTGKGLVPSVSQQVFVR